LLGDARRHRGEHLAEALARRAVDDLLALALGAHRLGQAVPLAVGEEAGRADDERAHVLGVLAGPAQPDEPAPVVDAQRDGAVGALGVEALDGVDHPLPRVRWVGRRVAVAREVGRQRVPAGLRRALDKRRPHVSRLGVPVDAQQRAARLAIGARLEVGEHRATLTP
jgi:hypothetical protein